ncbi:phage terminase large subunit [Niallia taxi]|uniref:phage terminase large subunit n=1 Tax=Niallia taxi TaxID=2499688 RepID=UPI002934219B|nr:phage terminase large subunit [Niallia taxi]WOD61772.1 phage terminase large subunit [Niallia taxi]
MDVELIKQQLALQREMKLRIARKSFWEFCKVLEPDFYKEDRTYLKVICTTLQGLYDGTLINYKTGKPYKKLMMNIPPRHGKSRSLVNFTKWLLGINNQNKIITASYNDDMATDFSRYCRDGIKETKNIPTDIIYNDVFPNTRIKDGNASVQTWALEGSFFSYKGVGIGGGVTGKGANILICDDLVKDIEVATNDDSLEKIWKWYTGTFISRAESNSIEIMNMTRWANDDPCGKILQTEDADEWYVLKMEAYDEKTDTMLCEDVLSKERYFYLKRNTDPLAFMSNYHQEPIDVKGSLYKEIQVYNDVPTDSKGHPDFEQIISYTDTADLGNDYLCSIVAGIRKGEAYILDVYYSKDGMEVTEPNTAELFYKNKVDYAKIESNNGGRGFARNVERLLWDNHQTRKPVISWFHQSKNKKARILSNSHFIMKHVYFPHDWNVKWKDFYKAITTYQKDKKNKNDDAVDALTGIVEIIGKKPATVKFFKGGL